MPAVLPELRPLVVAAGMRMAGRSLGGFITPSACFLPLATALCLVRACTHGRSMAEGYERMPDARRMKGTFCAPSPVGDYCKRLLLVVVSGASIFASTPLLVERKDVALEQLDGLRFEYEPFIL